VTVYVSVAGESGTFLGGGWTSCGVQVLAGLQVPFLCTETHELGEEIVAS
jgi:hypothetical protein